MTSVGSTPPPRAAPLRVRSPASACSHRPALSARRTERSHARLRYVFATVGTLFFSFFVGYCLALLLVVGPLTPALALLLWPCAAACGGAEYRQRHGLRKLMGKIWMFACLPVKKVLED